MANGRLGIFATLTFLICAPIAFSANFDYKKYMNITPSPSQSNYDVLVNPDAQSVISAGKTLPNCSDRW